MLFNAIFTAIFKKRNDYIFILLLLKKEKVVFQKKDLKMFLFLIPLLLISFVFEMEFAHIVDNFFVRIFPMFEMSPENDMGLFFNNNK